MSSTINSCLNSPASRLNGAEIVVECPLDCRWMLSRLSLNVLSIVVEWYQHKVETGIERGWRDTILPFSRSRMCHADGAFFVILSWRSRLTAKWWMPKNIELVRLKYGSSAFRVDSVTQPRRGWLCITPGKERSDAAWGVLGWSVTLDLLPRRGRLHEVRYVSEGFIIRQNSAPRRSQPLRGWTSGIQAPSIIPRLRRYAPCLGLCRVCLSE